MLLTRIDAPSNMARFYRLDIATDLFGGVVLVRSWGRIGQRGQACQSWFPDHARAEAERAKWQRRKIRRGYLPALAG
jgi:predicted DNA-binding WGR domain protein